MPTTFIPRRSLRLLLKGHYNPYLESAISHKETRVQPTKKQRKKFQVNTELPHVPVEACFDYSRNEYQRRNILKPVCWITFLLFLSYGCVCLTTTLRRQYQEYLVTQRNTDTVVTPGCKKRESLFSELQEKLLTLEKKLGYLLPSADVLPNFALKSLGAKILHEMTSATYRAKGKFFGFTWRKASVPPDIVIEGRSRFVPGECWAFEGSQGRFSIVLPYKVYISHVSLGHISKLLTFNGVSSALKDFSVYGKEDVENEETLLGTFLYDENGDPLQTFNIPHHKTGSFRYIILEVKNNWGHPDYTCLYGFRVHGKIAE
ncbi:SUN domain-containing protein 3-like [Cyprinodon tularosa]|uniref:SUN domain-containing protein 3-like n=1 Tax=Cyprinodon tularosa TaxID=77115 RepID=UPI0018E27F2D|nr:SUN domain-containing protein 3-like [Cyprinodon tularosa]